MFAQLVLYSVSQLPSLYYFEFFVTFKLWLTVLFGLPASSYLQSHDLEDHLCTAPAQSGTTSLGGGCPG